MYCNFGSKKYEFFFFNYNIFLSFSSKPNPGSRIGSGPAITRGKMLDPDPNLDQNDFMRFRFWIKLRTGSKQYLAQPLEKFRFRFRIQIRNRIKTIFRKPYFILFTFLSMLWNIRIQIRFRN
jgi:hypothetical protein